jgi:transcriptional regulator with XRE-family HTH domain
MSPLAELIKSARDAREWTQDDLAEAMGVSRGYIGQLETGLIKRPRAKYMGLLERHLKLSREEILRATGELGPSVSTDVLAEIRRIARIPDHDDRMAELYLLPPEVIEVIESLAVDFVRQTFRQGRGGSRPKD